MLSIKNLCINIDDQAIIKNLDLTIGAGKVHAFMGPNGSGKTSLALALMGHPYYHITRGTVILNEIDITNFGPDQRVRAGLFLTFQHPPEIPGVSVFTFLKEAHAAVTRKHLSISMFKDLLFFHMALLGMEESFANRSLNEGFSGGEKKRLEMLQLLILQPKLAIIDEIDSGLDIDALVIVAKALNYVRKENPDFSVLLITHYQRILAYVQPDVVHIIHNGRIIKTGDKQLAVELEKKGYDVYI